MYFNNFIFQICYDLTNYNYNLILPLLIINCSLVIFNNNPNGFMLFMSVVIDIN